METDDHLGWLRLPVDPELPVRPAGAHLTGPRADDTIGDGVPVITTDVEMVDERLARHRIEGLEAVREAELVLVEDTSIDFNESHRSSRRATPRFSDPALRSPVKPRY